MNQLNLIAVPNGAYTFEEFLASEPSKLTIHNLQSLEASEEEKTKSFLVVYQMVDTLAQLHRQGFDLKDVNMEGLRNNMTYTVNVGYDSIMKTFTNHQRKTIRDLVMHKPAAA